MNKANSRRSVCTRCGTVNRVPDDKPAAAAKCGRCAAFLSLGKPAELDDGILAKLLQGTDGLVLLDVWAPWCGPCRAMAPNFEAAAETLAGEARLVKLNADNSQMVGQLGVSGIPALILFRDGRIVDRKAGLMSADMLVQWVRSHARAKVTPNF
jgi:thioredoxin 2